VRKSIPFSNPGWSLLAYSVRILSRVARAALATMIFATIFDICFRQLNIAFPGAYDIVRVSGAVALACALPATTAVKGHIAVEFFFHKLRRRGRLVVDSIVHGSIIVMFALASWQCVVFAEKYRISGEVTPTIQIPLFWVPWVMALGCALSALVSIYHLTHPGKEMLKT
jgi:TRAP-type C4-dicarboxylate transport system permease small subunit